MQSTWFKTGAFACSWLIVCGAMAGVVPPGFEITRATIDGGGVMRSTSGDFELSGTIGQPDAGTLTGGMFELNGGFWIPIPPGDCEEDGDVGLMDFDRFRVCLSGPEQGTVSPFCQCFDIDHSRSVDLADVAAFQASFTGDH